MAEDERPSRFGPVVLLGAASAALTALAGSKDWFTAPVDLKTDVAVADPSADMPLALALGLVVLAAWGVVLVTGARARRVVVLLGALAAVGVVACVVVAPLTLPDDVRERLLGGSDDVAVGPTGWYVAGAVASVVTLVMLVVAWRLVPRWPTMSTRYDAPTAGGSDPDIDLSTSASIDVWKAFDEGRDPTAR